MAFCRGFAPYRLLGTRAEAQSSAELSLMEGRLTSGPGAWRMCGFTTGSLLIRMYKRSTTLLLQHHPFALPPFLLSSADPILTPGKQAIVRLVLGQLFGTATLR